MRFRIGVNFATEPVSVATAAAPSIPAPDVEAPKLPPFDPTPPALGAGSAKDAEGISACAAAKRSVPFAPLTISVKFGPLISSAVSFKTLVTSPA